MYTLEWTPYFTKAARKFTRQKPKLNRRVTQVLCSLEGDPFQPSLKLHSLSGKLSGPHAIRLTYSYRITLTLKVTEKVVVLLDIGSHDEIY